MYWNLFTANKSRSNTKWQNATSTAHVCTSKYKPKNIWKVTTFDECSGCFTIGTYHDDDCFNISTSKTVFVITTHWAHTHIQYLSAKVALPNGKRCEKQCETILQVLYDTIFHCWYSSLSVEFFEWLSYSSRVFAFEQKRKTGLFEWVRVNCCRLFRFDYFIYGVVVYCVYVCVKFIMAHLSTSRACKFCCCFLAAALLQRHRNFLSKIPLKHI